MAKTTPKTVSETIADLQQKEVEQATEAFNELSKKWSEKYPNYFLDNAAGLRAIEGQPLPFCIRLKGK